jgi:hypothetical protein
MPIFNERVTPEPTGSRLNSILGPLLLLSALGFVFILAAGSNLAGAILGMLPAA